MKNIMTKKELKKLINEVLSETQFLKENLPAGKSDKARKAAITLNNICDLIVRPDIQNQAHELAGKLIELIDSDV